MLQSAVNHFARETTLDIEDDVFGSEQGLQIECCELGMCYGGNDCIEPFVTSMPYSCFTISGDAQGS